MSRGFLRTAGLGLGLLLLLVTAIPAPFTVDDVHYLVSVAALRDGRLTVPGTEEFPPVGEILAFDPQRRSRRIDETPVSPTVPPLYAILALPFSPVGWWGLVGLNVLSLGLVAWGIWSMTRRYATQVGSPALAVGIAVAGGFLIEYSQGVWPHLLSMALVLGAVMAVDRAAEEDGPLALGVAGGVLAGLAAGVRYQNIVVAGALGLGLLLTGSHRWRASVAFASGVAVPLAVSTILNGLRLGLWNPITKGGGYLQPTSGGAVGSPLDDAIVTAWFRIVDFGVRPPLDPERFPWLHHEPTSGVFLVAGVMKKAWIQSSPWVLLALVLAAIAWWPSKTGRPEGASRRSLQARRRFGLVIAAMLAAFAVAGSARTDGLGFNQRYFLELVPLAAILLAWELEAVSIRIFRPMGLGVIAGGGAFVVLTMLPAGDPGRLSLERWAPLLLAAALAASWVASRAVWPSSSRTAGFLVVLLSGASVAWGAAVHLLIDLPASRELRIHNQSIMEGLRSSLPSGPAAVFAYGGRIDPVVGLSLERNLVALDLEVDDGAGAPEVRRAAERAGRRVFLLEPVPARVRERAFGDAEIAYRGSVVGGLYEILPAAPPAP